MSHPQSSTKKIPGKIRTESRTKKSKSGKGAGILLRRKAGKAVNSPIKALSINYNFANSVVAEILDVSAKTLTRYQDNAKSLSAQQRDRIKIVESILAMGKRVLGSEEEVKNWLYRPVHSIENQRPIDLIVSESGRRRVESVLLQIEGGVY
jgi:putative toxin-antitoxin system antitoxin component (TIGR02293 family)